MTCFPPLYVASSIYIVHNLCSAGLMVMDCLTSHLSVKAPILPSILKDNHAWQLIVFKTIYYSMLLVLLMWNPMLFCFCLWKWTGVFSLYLPIPWSVFYTLTTICHGEILLWSLPFRVSKVFSVRISTSFSIVWIFSAVILMNKFHMPSVLSQHFLLPI